MKSIKDFIKEERIREEEAYKMVVDIAKKLSEEINSSPMNGVTVVPGKLKICYVNLHSLDKGNLSAETYHPSSQAEKVREKIIRCKSVGNAIEAIQNMLRDKYILVSVYGSNNPYRITLNSKTLSIIENWCKSGGIDTTNQ